jgi:abortive infection bacteriophage resistance protein
VVKEALSIPSQLALLKKRGLLDSRDQLPRALMTHGYYRLSGYWRYYQTAPLEGQNAFEVGTDFAEILDIYRMDANLRNLLLEGMAEVEIALRTMLVAVLCNPGSDGTEYQLAGTYGDRTNQHGDGLRDLLLRDIESDVRRSKERHAVHYMRSGYEAVPLWVASEALSFGLLSRMYGLLSAEDSQMRIAKRFNYDGGLFTSFAINIRAIAVFRNVCAHHSRIWNRTVDHDIPRIFAGVCDPDIPRRQYLNTPWGVVAVLSHLVRAVRSNDSFSKAVREMIPSSGPYWAGLTEPSRK